MDTPIQRDDSAKFKQEVPEGATLIARLNDTANGIRVRNSHNIYELPQIHLQSAILANFLNIRNLGFGENLDSFIKQGNEGNLELCDDRKSSDYHFLWKGTFQEINAEATRSLANKMQVTPESITRKIYPDKILQLLENKPEGEREAIQDKFLDNVEKFLLLKEQANTPEQNFAGGLGVLLSAAAIVSGNIKGQAIGQPQNADSLDVLGYATAAIIVNRHIIGTFTPYPERGQRDEALDIIVRKFHEKVEPSPHVEYLDTSSSRSASTGYEISSPSDVRKIPNSNLRRRTPSSELFLENSPKREDIRVIKSAIERGEKRGIAIQNLQNHLDDVETFLKGTSNKSTQTEAQEPGPAHEKAGRLPRTLREYRALERKWEKAVQALESQVDHLGQFDLDDVQWSLAAKRFSAMRGTSDKSTQTEARAESSQSRGRSTSVTRLSVLMHAQGGAARSPSHDSQQRSR